MNEFRRSLLFFLGLFTGVGILLLFGIVYALTPSYKRTTLETIASPDHQHEITLYRTIKGSTALMSEVRQIDMEHRFGGKSDLTKGIHFETDSYGDIRSTFEDVFVRRDWRSKKVFVLSYPSHRYLVSRSINVLNRSASAIDSITIFGDEIYTVVDIKQNSNVEIPVKWLERNGIFTCGVSAVVHFASGAGIPRKYLAFQFSSSTITESEWLDGKREKLTDCLNGRIIVRDEKIEYSTLPSSD